MKNTHGEVLILVKLKVTLSRGCFTRFLNCTNDTRSHKASVIVDHNKFYFGPFLVKNDNFKKRNAKNLNNSFHYFLLLGPFFPTFRARQRILLSIRIYGPLSQPNIRSNSGKICVHSSNCIQTEWQTDGHTDRQTARETDRQT